jgi:hypothetical protein
VDDDAIRGIASGRRIAAPWRAGMAYALGYMRAAIGIIEGS